MKQLIGLLMAMVLPVVVNAQLTFTTNYDNTITITGYTGPSDVVVIPSVINGYPVTTIGDYAFCPDFGNTSLISVTIPDSVTVIGNGAFQDCGLNSITIPNSVNTIEQGAFIFCDSLTNITIGTNVTSIGDSAFSGCSSLTNILIPASIANIGLGTFIGCASLTAINVDPANPAYISVDCVLFNQSQTVLIAYPIGKTDTSYKIPDSVTDIEAGAFEESTLSSVIFGTNVTDIEVLAFYGSSLTNVAIPNSVTYIEPIAFAGCASLTAITVDSGNFAFKSLNGVLFNQNLTTLIQYPGAPEGSYTIPNGVITIINGAFEGSSLANILVPNSVTNIEYNAFNNCNNLTAIIVDPANQAYSNVNGVLFDKNQTTLIIYPPANGSSNYTIPKSVTDINDDAFMNCTGLNTVTFPNSVTNMGINTFDLCYNLSAFYFEGNVPGSFSFEGNFPGDPSTDFYGVFATVYYLPGTTGWGATYGGQPTALWLPQAQTADGSFGVKTNQFGFNINWASEQTVVVEACTNFSNPVWQPVQTNMLTSGSYYFSDPQWTNYPARFYRLRSP